MQQEATIVRRVEGAELVERLDDENIIEMLTGHAIQEYVYSFKQGSRVVEGLTIAGINEAANQRGHIVVSDVEVKETETSWLAVVKATDTKTSSSRFGAYEQFKNPTGKNDPYAFTKAVHKAQRNAIKQLLPLPIIQKIIKFYLNKR